MKMVDLFAGIGVASLAAETVFPGIEHEFVEINPFSQTILKKHFPNAPIYPDIRTYHPTGAVDIVWGSPPCQAASQAGKRKGPADSRWLWPDYFRVIGEAKPKWTIAENVYGLLSLDNGLAFEDLCRGLENLEYTVRTYIIPALAVGAPHRRDRVWIIGYSKDCFLQKVCEVSTGDESPDTRGSDRTDERIIAHSINDSNTRWYWTEDWRTVAARTCVRSVDDGPVGGLFRLTNGKTITAAGLRTERLKALGNSLCYPLVVKLFEAIKYAEDNQGGNATITNQ